MACVLMGALRKIGAALLALVAVVAVLAGAGLLLFVLYVAVGPIAALAVYLWEVLPDLLRVPHLVALGLVVIGVTAFVTGRGALGRGELAAEEAGAGCLFLPLVILLPAVLLYLLPALVLVLLVQNVWLAVPIDWKDPADFALHVFLPAAKIGLLFSIAGNFSDLASLRGTRPLHRHVGQFLLALAPAYYGLLGVSALVGRGLASFAPPFRPLIPLHRLFALPRVAPDAALNGVILAVLVAAAAVASHFLRKNRTAARRAEAAS